MQQLNRTLDQYEFNIPAGVTCFRDICRHTAVPFVKSAT